MVTAYINQLGLADMPWRWSVEFDYHPDLIAAIKANIPSRARKWDGANRRWLVKGEYAQAVYELCRKHHLDVKFDTPKPCREAAKLQRRGHFRAIIRGCARHPVRATHARSHK